MNPSDIDVEGVPLVGTFGKCEGELAAMWVIRVLAIEGDEWRLLGVTELRPHLELLLTVTPPFLEPNFDWMADNGYMKFTCDRAFVELTPRGLWHLKLSHWNRNESDRLAFEAESRLRGFQHLDLKERAAAYEGLYG